MDRNIFLKPDGSNNKDEFIQRIEELILDGVIKIGERLPSERELSELFDVSRPVIHDGLLVLEKRGLIKIRPRHGVIVLDYRRSGNLDLLLSLLNRPEHEITPAIAGDLEHVRIRLEQDMTVCILENNRNLKKLISELRKINSKMMGLKEPVEIAEKDFEYHTTLSLASGNAIYALLVNTLKPAHMHLLTRFYREEGVLQKVVDYHERFIDLLERGDREKLISLIRQADSYSGYK